MWYIKVVNFLKNLIYGPPTVGKDVHNIITVLPTVIHTFDKQSN